MVESVGHWMSLPTVSVLILNYNGRQHLETCLPSLDAQVYPKDRVRIEVIDNGSTDGSAEFVRTRHPGIIWHQLDRNYGFAQPYDDAARRSTSDCIAFLNNDTRVEPTWLAELVSAAERHEAQCVAARILDWDGKRIDFVGGLVSYLGHCWQLHHGEPVTGGAESDEEGRRLLFACGGSMLVSRAAYVDAGGFDADFFAYFEDIDFGWRLSMLGYRTVLAPRAVTYHRLHGTAAKIAYAQRLRLYERNALAMLYKNYESETLLRVLPSAIVLSLLRGLGHSDIDPQAFAFGAAHSEHMPVSARTIVHLLALEDFCSQLPALGRKRAAIQSRRRMGDRELIALFGDPFRLHEAGRYEKVAHSLIRDFDLESIFNRGVAPSSGSDVAAPAKEIGLAHRPEPAHVSLESPLVSVVILTALGPAHLGDCLPSLRAQTYPADRIEIIVVDNGSAEDPTPFVLERFPRARVIRNGTNLGFAVANNIGAAAASGEYVAFLNDDTRVHPDWLRELVRTAARRQAACVASRILTWDGRRIDFAGGSVNFEGKGFQLDTGAPEAGRYTEERPLLFGCGGALLLNREIFLDHGGWDEGTFAYYEDVELGWRLWLLGHEVWFCPRSVVFHRHHGTSGRWAEPPRRRLYERNSLRMLYTLLERESLERVLPAAVLLAADRILLASHVSRVADRSGATEELSPARPSRSRLSAMKERTKAALRAQGVSRRHSVAQNLRLVGVRGLFGVAQQVAQDSIPMSGAHRAHYDVERGVAPLSLDGQSEAIPVEAVAALAGLREFIESIPALSKRRAWLQASRRRTDREILGRFREHWISPVGSAHQLEHEAFHRALLDSLAIDGLIEVTTSVGDGRG